MCAPLSELIGAACVSSGLRQLNGHCVVVHFVVLAIVVRSVCVVVKTMGCELFVSTG